MAMTDSLPPQWMLGMTWTILAGAMQGGFPLPLKFMRKWRWENLWLASSVLGLTAIPWLIAWQTIPSLPVALGAVPARSLLVVALFGMAWGIGGLLFGLAVHRVGLSLATAVVLGLTSGIGSLAPLAILHPEAMLRRTGLVVIGSVAVAIFGIVCCARAGARREQTAGRSGYRAGLMLCVLSGLLSPMFNFALTSGGDLIEAAKAQGALAADAANMIWSVAMTGGLMPTALYCGWRLSRVRSWSLFTAEGAWHDTSLAVVMGLLFAYGNSFYGTGAGYLGHLGPILGWPVFLSAQVVVGNLLGIATGEWRGAPPAARAWLAAGMITLIAAMFLIAQAES